MIAVAARLSMPDLYSEHILGHAATIADPGRLAWHVQKRSSELGEPGAQDKGNAAGLRDSAGDPTARALTRRTLAYCVQLCFWK